MRADTVTSVAERWKSLAGGRAQGPRFMELADAVREAVRHGDTLYFGGSMARPNAAMFEIVRAFWGRSPAFTLVAPAVANQHAPMVAGGLVSRVISSIQAMTYPTPAPHPVYVQAAREHSVVFENWSLLTLSQRLMAAAMGLPFLPTRSLAGSDMATALATETGDTAEVASPFDGTPTQVVAPLVPDVTFVHGLAADEDGNILICPPLYDGIWAAFCAKRTVVVTVDHMISREAMRRHADHVRIPAHAVGIVCHVPLGGHPNSLPSAPVPELAGYPDDYAFLLDLRNAGKSKETLLAWTQEWILDCKDHNAYLTKLGSERIHALRGRALADGWRFEACALEATPWHPANEAETHVCLAARVIRRRLERGATSAMLAGLGISSLAAWMASIQRGQDGVHLPLMVESGMYGYLPSPGDPFLFNYRNMAGSAMLSDALVTLGLLTAGSSNRALGVLGAAQVDAAGNLNTSQLPKMLLTGSGGANDIGSAAADVMVTIAHSPDRLVRQVDFITTPGRAVKAVVTPLAVFEREQADQPFTLTAVIARDGLPLQTLIEQALDRCAWEVSVAPTVLLEPSPAPDELALARQLDPDGLFLG
ncbi:CoA-transferase [Ramlibacter sp. WS9]|uniref:CoA-transferase n=1 Tax=Ramlibacter sp. WS9 TaxID=1882741 RepID=UPI001143A3AC|nr:CoA-transferase [Ramlibacter sp. WS9]ROZ79399.1 hypothetical protein EEB15_00310 [Ramlibacter sp. WS9]